MLVTRGKLENRQALIDIGIFPIVPTASVLSSTDGPAAMPINTYKALIDTGAQRSCLSLSAIAREGLVSHGKRSISNIHDVKPHRLYFINLGFWSNGTIGSNSEIQKSYFGWDRPIEVINIADNHNFDAIIGMDVMEHFSFRFDHDGSFEVELEPK
jgi:hypothetical protein